jgi:hypothetical protein
MNIADDNLQPKYPTFSDQLIMQCTQNCDFRPILFEWYKFVGIFCNKISCISQDSQAFQKIPSVHYAVLIGLLNRCSRLMLANTRLSSTRKYGETTRILDRSISESAIKIQWLCHKDNIDSFIRYIADGLKKDLILKNQIEQNIQNRQDSTLVIEQRMLDSIQNCINLSGLSEHDVKKTKKLPDFAQMCKDLEIDDGFYTAIQRMGSHAVHGTWSELVFNYLQHESGQRFYPRDHKIETQDGQFIIIIRLVLGAMQSFLRYVISDVPERDEIITSLNEVEEKIIEIQHLAWTSDFSPKNYQLL